MYEFNERLNGRVQSRFPIDNEPKSATLEARAHEGHDHRSYGSPDHFQERGRGFFCALPAMNRQFPERRGL
jgi:hypothetical protein